MKDSRDEFMTMYDRVLIAVDGSNVAERAARRGVQIAVRFDADVDIIHVVERKRLQLTRSDDEVEQLRQRGERIVAAVEDMAGEFDVTATTTLAEGAPTEKICEHATEGDASIIVIGREGRSGLGKRLFGGVTEGILHRSAIPVLVVPGNDVVTPDEGFDRILVPTDGSANAERGGEHGAVIAQRYDAAVHVLNVVDLQSAGGVFDAGGLDKAFVERLEARGRQAVDSLTEVIQASAPDVEVESRVVRSTDFDGVAGGVRTYADEEAIDLVVIGSHGRSNLKRQFLGSVATSVLGTVEIPVLVVPRNTRS